MNNIVTMLKTGSLKYIGGGLSLEFHDLSEANKQESPRVIGSHLTYPFVPDSVKAGTGKVINLLRNPKDSFVSFSKYFDAMYNTGYEGDMDGFLRFFLSDECKCMIPFH